MRPVCLISHSAEETQLLGRHLGSLAQPGDVFLLTGGLGVGKTCLTQGIAWGLGVKEYAFSPSFVIVREYHGRLTLYHIDFYRLDNTAEIAALGLEEYLYGAGVSAIEWAEKGKEILPEENFTLRLEYLSETERSITIEARGERYLSLLDELAAELKELCSRDVTLNPSLRHSEEAKRPKNLAQDKLREGSRFRA